MRTMNSKLEGEHTPRAIRDRLAIRTSAGYLGDAVLGAIDGCVTTFALVAASVGGGFSGNVIIVLGFANLIADAFSMGVTNYLGTKSQHQSRQAHRHWRAHRGTESWPCRRRGAGRLRGRGRLFFEDISGQVLHDDELSLLLNFPNVLITAHQAFHTHEALSEIARVTTANLVRFAEGQPFPEVSILVDVPGSNEQVAHTLKRGVTA